MTSLFEIRFQSEPPAFLLRALVSEDDYGRSESPRLEPLAGRYSTNWWTIRAVHPGQVQFLNSHDGRERTEGAGTNTYYWEHERWATEFLRLGMFDLMLPTLEWTGDGSVFRAAAESGAVVEGRIVAGPVPESATIFLEHSGDEPSREITVEFAAESDRWLPRRLTIHLLVEQQGTRDRREYARLEAAAWKVAELSLPREWFSPEPFLRTNDLWVETLGGRFYLLEDTGTGIVRTLVTSPGSRWHLQRLAKYLYGLTILAGAVGVGWHYLSGWRDGLKARSSAEKTH